MADLGGGIGWVAAVNLVVWTGLFLYLLRLHRLVRAAERAPDRAESGERAAGEGAR